MAQLLTVCGKIYIVSPENGEHKEFNSDDWATATTAALIPSTQNVYITTTFNNLWEISLDKKEQRKVSWDGWGTCNALVAVPNGEGGHKLFAFCHKLWLIDDLKTGRCTDFGGFADVWTRVNAAAAVGHIIFATTSANNLWRIDSTRKEGPPKKLGDNSGNWSTCKALVEVNGRLIAFCYSLWEVNIDTGESTLFFDSNSNDAKRSWLDVKSATVIGHNIYVVVGKQLLELDTVSKKIREVDSEDWGNTKAMVAAEIP